MTTTNENDIQMETLEPNIDNNDSSTDTDEVDNVRITRRMAREQGGIKQIESALGSKRVNKSEENFSKWESSGVNEDITGLDKITSFSAFMMGVLMNWGSFNVMGFLMGMNYRFFLNRDNTSRIYLDLQTVLPAFVLGVFLVNIHLMYFTASVVAGYTYRSKGGSLQENVNLVYEKIPKRYRDNMRFGTRNEFLRGFIGVVSDNANNVETTKKAD